jgi:hypothetical protein
MTTILIENANTMAKEVVTIPYDLPSYGIGYNVHYKSKGLDLEGIVIGFRLDVFLDADGVINTQVTYDIDNGDAILEDEVLFYNEPEEDMLSYISG